MIKRIAGVLLVAVLCCLCYLGYNSYIKEKQTAGLQAAGTIEATQVELRSKVAGTLQGLTIAPGNPVKENQLVANIMRNDLAAQKERDALTVAKAQAQLDDLTSGAREQEIREAEIAVDRAQINYDQAAKDYNRASVLFKQSAIPETDIEKAETAFKQSQNSLESAMVRLNLLQAGGRTDQIEAARVELERSVAFRKQLKRLLKTRKSSVRSRGRY